MGFMCRPSPVFIEIAQKIAVSGPWMNGTGHHPLTPQPQLITAPGGYYPSHFWATLVAAVERGVVGSGAAWTKVMTNITNLSTWSAGFGPDPRWGTYPRNK